MPGRLEFRGVHASPFEFRFGHNRPSFDLDELLIRPVVAFDMPRVGMNNDEKNSSYPPRAALPPAIDSEPPIALDKFLEKSGISATTIWRYRRAGWLSTLNICGRHYLTRAEITRFNTRAASGEFAKQSARPRRRLN
jgi:hypothetical protein